MAHVDHDHDHDHHDHHDHDDHGRAHGHGHAHGGWQELLRGLLPFGHGHSHDIGDTASDQAMESSGIGLRVVALSLVGLGITAIVQVVIAIASGSVGLLADTIHNAADALTAIPLWIACTLGKRPPNSRYTYGCGRAEDAGTSGTEGFLLAPPDTDGLADRMARVAADPAASAAMGARGKETVEKELLWTELAERLERLFLDTANGRPNRASASSGMPMPVSAMETLTQPPAVARARIVTRPPSGVNFTALDRRLRMICLSSR